MISFFASIGSDPVRKLYLTVALLLPLTACNVLNPKDSFDNGHQCVTHLVNAPLGNYDEVIKMDPQFVSLNSVDGQKRIADCTHCTDYPALSSAYLTQATQTFCGVASSVMVMNADSASLKWRPVTQPYEPFHYYTQCNVLNDNVAKLLDIPGILHKGMNLQEIKVLIDNQPTVKQSRCTIAGEAPLANRVDSTNACDFNHRQQAVVDKIKQALQNKSTYVIANFAGAPVRTRGGHFSPIAAYHKQSDSFLIMDVARYKHPPFWISSTQLWQSMNQVDKESGLSRGLIIVTTKGT